MAPPFTGSSLIPHPPTEGGLYEAHPLFVSRHGVGANPGKTKPAKLLAVFMVDANEMELTIPFGN